MSYVLGERGVGKCLGEVGQEKTVISHAKTPHYNLLISWAVIIIQGLGDYRLYISLPVTSYDDPPCLAAVAENFCIFLFVKKI
jgi:hypothetical protein